MEDLVSVVLARKKKYEKTKCINWQSINQLHPNALIVLNIVVNMLDLETLKIAFYGLHYYSKLQHLPFLLWLIVLSKTIIFDRKLFSSISKPGNDKKKTNKNYFCTLKYH